MASTFRSFLISAALVLSASAGMIGLKWDPSPDPDVIGYKIYAGTNSGTYIQSINVSNVTETRINIPNTDRDSVWFFAATAYNAEGLESDFSNEVSAEFPKAPTNSRLVVVEGSITLTNWTPVYFLRLVIP